MIEIDEEWGVTTDKERAPASPYLVHRPCQNIINLITPGYTRLVALIVYDIDDPINQCANCAKRPTDLVLKKVKFIYENSVVR